MRVAVAHGDERASSDSMMYRKRSGVISVAFAEITTIEAIACGLRQTMFELTDEDGKEVAHVSTGAGWGSDFITIDLADRRYMVRGIDLVRALAARNEPGLVERLPRGLGPTPRKKGGA